MDDMNNSMSWTQASGCYELLEAMKDINNFKSWTQGSRCYEKLRT